MTSDVGQHTALPWHMDKELSVDAYTILDSKDRYIASFVRLETAAQIVAEHNAHAALVAALREIEAHHVELNNKAGRPLERSRTLRIARRALAASACGSTATESR